MFKHKTKDITWHNAHIGRKDKEKLLGQKGVLLWFTGLSAAGKSTIAHRVEAELLKQDRLTIVLDGDNIRHGLNKDLGFSPEDREENIRRIGEVAKLFVETGIVTMTAFISPYRADRDRVRANLKDGEFIEVYVKCPLEVAEKRDPKKLYQKARAGVIKEFTGISAPYEEPLNPEITLDTSTLSVAESISILIDYLTRNGYLQNRV